ncbi:MAG: T9SS type A sorting domain-containing protein [Rhodothermales bacterium]
MQQLSDTDARAIAGAVSVPIHLSHSARRFAAALILLLFTAATASAQTQVIDFENLAEGKIVSELASANGYGGITVKGTNPGCPARNAAVIYASSCPGGCTGDDEDLGTPNASFGGPGIGAGGQAGSPFANDTALGNVLIVQQGCSTLDTDPVTEPRDHGGNTTLLLTFPTPVSISRFTALDVETSESLVIEFLDEAGTVVSRVNAPATGNNGVAEVPVSAVDVLGMRVLRQGSGALDDILFTPAASADLELAKSVDNPAPDSGATVVFTIALTNQGPDDATDIRIEDRMPAGLTFVEYVGAGTVVTRPGSFEIAIDALAVGETAVGTLTARVETGQPIENIVEVMAAQPMDPDSTPGNGDTSEDDWASAAVTPGNTSGGGDGGIESNGDMATQLARRLFNRRQDARAARALLAAPAPVPFVPALAKGERVYGVASDEIANIIPVEGPQLSRAFQVSPTDLLDFTNATSVLAVDYVRLDGRRMAAIFTATSPSGELYDHTKVTCDRLGGGMLSDVRIVNVGGHPFVLSKLHQPNGDIDYAISFVAYRQGDRYTIDSRFASEEYTVPAGIDDVINMQVWSVAPDYTEALLADLLARLEQRGTVVYANGANQAPQLFVMDGVYRQGRLSLRLANRIGQTEVKLHGSFALSESDADRHFRTPFERIVTVPAPAPNEAFSTIELEVGAIYDAVLFVEHEASRSHDQIYHADGPWSFAAAGTSTVEDFATHGYAQPFDAGRYVIERGGTLEGDVTDWASLFRYLRPNGEPVDLSAYQNLSFSAYGEGTVRLVVEKAGIDTWDQFGYTFELTPDPKTFVVDFSELRRQLVQGEPFDAGDVTLLAFYVLGNGQTSTPFTIHVEHLSFGLDGAEGLDRSTPLAFSLDQNFPNPFNPTTEIAFTLSEASEVRLTVYDMLGREMAVLVDGLQPAGRNVVSFEARDLPSGLYLYRIETPKGETGRLMSLLK